MQKNVWKLPDLILIPSTKPFVPWRGNTDKTNLYTRPREVRRKAYVVIAGDRGLAGGYNVNILRFAESQMDPETALVIPVGKRAVDHFSRRAYETRVFQEYAAVESIDLERSFELARLLTDLFRSGEADEVVLVYIMICFDAVPGAGLPQDPAAVLYSGGTGRPQPGRYLWRSRI